MKAQAEAVAGDPGDPEEQAFAPSAIEEFYPDHAASNAVTISETVGDLKVGCTAGSRIANSAVADRGRIRHGYLGSS